MGLILAIDLVVVLLLCGTAARRGLEATLPLSAFFLTVVPNESQLRLAGVFDLTTQRVVVVTLLVLFIARRGVEAPPDPPRPLPLRKALFILLFWWMLSALHSVVPTISFKTVLSQLLDFCAVYYIFAKTIRHRITADLILHAIVIAMLVCSIIGVGEAYWNWRIAALFPPVDYRFGSLASIADRGVRIQSTFSHPILYGSALAMAIPAALYLASKAQSSFHRGLLWLAIVLAFLNIYKTGSRGPWLACAGSCVLLLVFSRSGLRKTTISVVLLACLALVVRPGVWRSVADLYAETLNPDTAQGESYQWRYVLLDVAQRQLRNQGLRTLWGYGPESFYYLGITTMFEGHLMKVDSCDSSVAALLIETGYVGLALVVFVLFKGVYHICHSVTTADGEDRNLYIVLLAGLGAFYFMMTNVAVLGWGQQSYLLWIFLAIGQTSPYAVSTVAEGANAGAGRYRWECDRTPDDLAAVGMV